MDTAEEIKRQRARERQAAHRARHPELKEYHRQWASKNRDRVRASQAKYLAKDPDKKKDAARQWRIANKDRIRATKAKCFSRNPEMYRNHKRKWALQNPEKVKASEANYRSKYADTIRERRAIYLAKHPRKPAWWKESYQKNKAKVCARNKAWMEKNKEKMRPVLRAKWARRRALKKAATINLRGIKQWMKSVMARPVNVCYYCQLDIPKGKLHFDHIVALANGGSHSVENLCVSCASCNSDKHDKPIEAWLKVGQQIFAL